MNTKLILQAIHWCSLLSGAAVGLASAFTGDTKLAPMALVVISVAQVVHKFADAADHKDTLEQAISTVISQIKK